MECTKIKHARASNATAHKPDHAHTRARHTHTQTQPAESRVYGTRCLAAVAHQLKLPPDARAVPPTSRRQVKKAEHSGQHDRQQRAPQGTHERTRRSGVEGPRAHPLPQSPSRPHAWVCVLQQTWHTEAAVGQQEAHQQARSNDTDGSKGSTAHATCHPHDTPVERSSHTQGAHTHRGKEYIHDGQTRTHSEATLTSAALHAQPRANPNPWPGLNPCMTEPSVMWPPHQHTIVIVGGCRMTLLPAQTTCTAISSSAGRSSAVHPAVPAI